jgi:spermidine/putrescine transport system ATP-binding protein
MTEIAVELLNVSKVFPSRESAGEFVVNNVSLKIFQGEFYTILGSSGCGKTTTLRIIAGFETPSSGEVFIQGRAVRHLPPYRRPVNTVFQNYALFPHMTVAQNVAYGLKIRKVRLPERQQRVAEALAMVRLNGMEHRKPSELSGGQQQRAALARALVNRPAVLLLDEPLGALDLKLRKQMQYELKQLQARLAITFIYVTHDQEEALTMSDRIAVMNAGQVLQVGSPSAIYEEPATRFVADFIGETNFLSGTVMSSENDTVSVNIAGESMRFDRNSQDCRIDQAVTLAIRPERMEIAVRHETPTIMRDRKHLAALPGTVESCMFIGTDSRYIVRLQNGEMVVVRLQNSHEHEKYNIGAQVKVWCCLADMRLLKD